MIRLFILCFCVTVLTSCATKAIDPTAITDESHQLWQAHQQNLKPFQQWFIRGRVALFVDDDVYNLGLGWKREGDISTFKLEAALGQGVIQINKDAHGVELRTSEGENFTGSNAQQVLYESTGLIIPVEGLETWIKGIPHQGSNYLPDIDASGRAMSIQQDGWLINFFEYQPVKLAEAGTRDLPHMLYMKHDNIALKLVIDQWQIKTFEFTPDYFPQFPG
jgi:outer membrane lipoprotein LolB